MKNVYISCYSSNDNFYKNEIKKVWNMRPHLFNLIKSDQNDFNVIKKTYDLDMIYNVKLRILKNTDVYIFLVGDDASKRKTIDWEIRAAMVENGMLSKAGIIVVFLPEILNGCEEKYPTEKLPLILQKNINTLNTSIVLTDWYKITKDWLTFERVLNVAYAYSKKAKYIVDKNILQKDLINFKK